MDKFKSIPKDIREEAIQIVESFNEENRTFFEMTFDEEYANLVLLDDQPMAHIFRQMIVQKTGTPPLQGDMKIAINIGSLKYNGHMNNWDFTTSTNNKESHNSGEEKKVNIEKFDGTIKSLLMAGLEFYA